MSFETENHVETDVTFVLNEDNSSEMRKLGSNLDSALEGSTMNSNLAFVIETDYLNKGVQGKGSSVKQKEYESSSQDLCHQASDKSLLTQPLLLSVPSVDDSQSSYLATLLAKKLDQISRQSRFSRHRILLPCHFVERVSKDIVRMSYCEPCGIRGLAIFLYLQRKQEGQCLKLGSIDCDHQTIATFELHLTLIEEKKKWTHYPLAFISSLRRCLSDHTKDDIFVSRGYQLEKKKLYRQNYTGAS